MATSTLLQKLDVQADGFGRTTSNRRQVETFLTTLTNAGGAPATITLAAGTWVAMDTSKTGANRVLYVAAAANVALGNPLVCGVVLNPVSALLAAGASIDLSVEVVVAGYADNANVDGAVIAGSPLTVDTTVGRAHVAVTGDISICGVALDADVANVAPVWVYKQF